MDFLINYILKVNLLLVFFWLFYRVFLRKETFYTPLRWYFVAGILLSLIFPLINYTQTVIIEQKITPSQFEVTDNFLPIEPQVLEASNPIDWQSILLFMVLIISALCLFRSVFQMVRLVTHIKRLPNFDQDKKVKIATNSTQIYSFFRWIVIPENKLSSTELSILLAHENIHLNQKHTLDLVLIEMISALFWFNPLIKFLQKDINTNLEYIVDQQMIIDFEPVSYQKTLLNVQNNCDTNIINSFNTSELKNRIIQLNKQKSNPMKKMKFLLTAPALVAFFAFFQVETVAQVQTTTETPDEYAQPETTTFELNLAKITQDRQVFDEVCKRYDIVIDDVLQTKEQLANFDHTTITNFYPELVNGEIKKVYMSTQAIDYAINTKNVSDEFTVRPTTVDTSDTKRVEKIAKMVEADDFKELMVYDRYGKPMYRTKSKQANVKKALNELDNGVYYYVLDTDIENFAGYVYIGENNTSISTSTITKDKTIIHNPAAGIDISNGDNQLILFDGEQVSYAEFKKVDPNTIAKIILLNPGELSEPYGEKGKNGVILATTKLDTGVSAQNELDERRQKAKEQRKKAVEKLMNDRESKNNTSNTLREERLNKHIKEIEQHKKEEEKKRQKAMQKNQKDAYAENFDTVETLFNDLKSLKEEVEDDNFTITHMSAKISDPETGMEIEMSENY